MDIIAAAGLIAVGIVVAAAVYARQGGRSHAVAATAGVAPRTRSVRHPRTPPPASAPINDGPVERSAELESREQALVAARS